jgi:galactose mutarotase-like enzyme
VTATVVLQNATLSAVITPGMGGTVTSLRHLPSGAEVLARPPWQAQGGPLPGGAGDEAEWLSRWGGGWPVMFPNAGDACRDGEVRHGFHGEGSVTPWEMDWDGAVLVLWRAFAAVPVRMERRFALQGGQLDLQETVRADGPCRVVWGQHVTLGGDLLAGQTRVETGARGVRACAAYDPAGNPAIPGAAGDWPHLPGKAGAVDLSAPPEGAALLACLTEFAGAPWARLVRAEDGLAVRLDWSADPWPLAWVWVETGGTPEAPWNGQARMIGIEPCSTWPATGLAAAHAAGGAVIRLAAGETRHARLTLTLETSDSED